jgi:4-aminobutyrate aminotransferase
VIRAEGLLANAAARGEQLLAGLRQLKARFPWLVEDVRGVGLMIGVELPNARLAGLVQAAAFQRGLLVLEAGESAIRMSPPLVVSRRQCQVALRLFSEAVEEVATGCGPRAGSALGSAGGDVAGG